MDFPPEIETVLLPARRLTHLHWNPDRRGRWSRPELQRHLEEEVEDDTQVPTLHVQHGGFSALLETDEVTGWPGRSATEYQAVLPMNLREIFEKAEGREDPDKSVRRGAKSGRDPEDRRYHHLTPSQLSTARQAARKLGGYFNDDDVEKGMEAVGREYFVWDPEGGTGEIGDWTKALNLLERACAQAGVSNDTTQTYKGGLKVLLDLAATREWIPRTELHNPDWTPVPPEWSDIYERWREVALDEGIRCVHGTLLRFLRTLSSCGADDPRRGPWEEVIPQLESQFETEERPPTYCTNVRRAYRLLRSTGELEGPEWKPRKERIENSPAVVRQPDCEMVGKLYGRDGHRVAVQAALDGERHPWPVRWQQHEVLVEGEYGLRRFALLCGTTRGEQEKLGLPERSGKRHRPSTISTKLYEMVKLAGIAGDGFGIDWSEADLRTLFRREHLEAYRTYLRQETNASPGTNRHRLILLGTVVGSFLLPLAKQHEDRQLVERFEHIYDLVYGDGVEGRSSWVDGLASEIEDGGATDVERRKAKSLLVERTWTGDGSGDFAYDQMRVVGDRALDLLRENYGPLEEQLAAVAEDRSTSGSGRIGTLDGRWAKDVRDALILWDQLVAPYRVATLMEMDLADRLHTENFARIMARVHKWKRKAPNAEWHRPNYRRSTDSPYPALLYRLYRTAGGAREVLLTRADGSRWAPDPSNRKHFRKPEEEDGQEGVLREPFYANRLTQSTYARLDRHGLRRAIKRATRKVLERWPDALGGVTYDDLMGPDGVLTPHAFRHALAKHMLCAPGLSDDERQGNRLAAVCNVLDHSDRTMVWEVYAGTSEADYDIGAMTSDGTSRPPDPEPTENPEDQVLEAARGLSAEERMELVRKLLSNGSDSVTAAADGS